jgi:hypothetical protein
MTAKILVSLLLFLPIHASAQQASFTALSLKRGQTLVRTSTYKMDVDVVMKFAGESLAEQNVVTTHTVRKTETIQEAKGDIITKLKVTYELVDNKTVVTEDGIQENKKNEPSPVAGRAYVVSVENGVLKVLDQYGFKPSQDELDIVAEDYEDLAEADTLVQFFRDRTVQVGERLQMPGAVASGIFTDAERRRIRVDQASFQLRNIRQNQAVFDSALKMQWNEDANTSIKMNLQGETIVGIQNSQFVSSSLSGTVRVTGADQVRNRLVMVDGKGKMIITETVKAR